MLAGKRARLVEQLAEIQDSIDFIDAKQRFYDDVLSGATPYVSVLHPNRGACKASQRNRRELKCGRGNRSGPSLFLPPGYKREQRFAVPALGERDMPLDWNQQAAQRDARIVFLMSEVVASIGQVIKVVRARSEVLRSRSSHELFVTQQALLLRREWQSRAST